VPLLAGNVDVVLRSEDRAKHWSLVASSTTWFTTPNVRPNFPATATVAPAGLPGTSLFSARGAWLVLASPSRLVRTTNGGRSWQDGAPASVESQGPLQVLDAGGTVVVRTRSALWRLGTRGWREVVSAGPAASGRTVPRIANRSDRLEALPAGHYGALLAMLGKRIAVVLSRVARLNAPGSRPVKDRAKGPGNRAWPPLRPLRPPFPEAGTMAAQSEPCEPDRAP
jgi:hypothetical protein